MCHAAFIVSCVLCFCVAPALGFLLNSGDEQLYLAGQLVLQAPGSGSFVSLPGSQTPREPGRAGSCKTSLVLKGI